jgi:hypothetical protein
VTDSPKNPKKAKVTVLHSQKPSKRRRAALPDAAFDLWLEQGLHAMYDDVAREPIPVELLALIEQDRKRS